MVSFQRESLADFSKKNKKQIKKLWGMGCRRGHIPRKSNVDTLMNFEASNYHKFVQEVKTW